MILLWINRVGNSNLTSNKNICRDEQASRLNGIARRYDSAAENLEETVRFKVSSGQKKIK